MNDKSKVAEHRAWKARAEHRKAKVLNACLAACSLAVTLPWPAAAQQQEPIGRLFFTPAQRSSLDVARSQRARATLSTERTEEQPVPQEQTITYSGAVRRSDGKSTAWINGRPVTEQDAAAAGQTVVGRVRADGSVSLQVPQSGRSVELKPGQSLELLSGTIEEGYSRRPVTPEPKPASKPPADAKPAGAAPSELNLKEREERARLEDAVAQALRDVAAAKAAEQPATTKPAEPPAPIPDRQGR